MITLVMTMLMINNDNPSDPPSSAIIPRIKDQVTKRLALFHQSMLSHLLTTSPGYL